jgi:hypothetical protein
MCYYMCAYVTLGVVEFTLCTTQTNMQSYEQIRHVQYIQRKFLQFSLGVPLKSLQLC